MNNTNHSDPEANANRWSDDQTELLLRGFLKSELASQLPRLRQFQQTPRAIRPLSIAAPQPRHPQAWGPLATMLSAAALLMCGLVFQAKLPNRNGLGFATAASGWQYSLVEVADPVERLRVETPHGMLDQRVDRKLTHITAMAANTGDAYEWTVPEVSIEISLAEDRTQ